MTRRAAPGSMALVLALSLIAAASAHASAPAPASTPAHYLIFSIDKKDDLTLISDREVAISGPMRNEPEEDTPKLKHEKKTVVSRVFDANGKQLFKKTVDVEQIIHAEHQGVWGLERRDVELDEAVFVVRVPILESEAEIELESVKSGKKKRFELKKPKKHAAVREVATDSFAFEPETQDIDNWYNPANRVNLLVLGDGYTSSQHSTFDTNVNTLVSGFFGVSPYYEYQNFVEMKSVFTASTQSGADHPTCSDPSKLSDPLEPSFVNTAFDATYCNSNIQRALVVNYTKVYNFAASYPDWDQIIVLVNDTLHGGTGGGISVYALDSTFIETAQHEHGHSFSGLADEYDYAGGGVGCSDTSGTWPCEPNVTNVTTRSLIKWNPWILGTTPVPTPETTSYDNVVGLFEGAKYQTSGMYRPKNHCLMKEFGYGFCAVCRQQYILELYDRIDQIEYPFPSSTTVYTAPGSGTTFSASVLNPYSGSPQTIEWRVNGTLQSGQSASSFTYTPATTGTYTIQMKAKDPTTLVNASMAGTTLEDTQTWTLNAIAPPPPSDFRATAYTEYATYIGMEWTPQANATSYRIEKSTDGVNWTYVTDVGGIYGYHSVSATLNTAYLFRIATTENGVRGPWGVDIAVAFTMTDPTISSATTIKAAHINEVRAAVNVARTQLTTLGNASYSTAPVTGGTVAAVHVTDTRTAIAQLRTALNLPAVSYTDPGLTAGYTSKKEHVTELRDAIR